MSRNSRLDVFSRIDMRGGDRSQCWPWTLKLWKGRPYFKYTDDEGKQCKELAYRTVYELVHGVVLLPAQFILHQCDNPPCCNPYEGHACKIGTHQDNMNEMKERERHGMSHHMVRTIKAMLRQGLTHQAIASITGKSRQTITEINRGTVYKHVGDSNDEGGGTEDTDQG